MCTEEMRKAWRVSAFLGSHRTRAGRAFDYLHSCLGEEASLSSLHRPRRQTLCVSYRPSTVTKCPKRLIRKDLFGLTVWDASVQGRSACGKAIHPAGGSSRGHPPRGCWEGESSRGEQPLSRIPFKDVLPMTSFPSLSLLKVLHLPVRPQAWAFGDIQDSIDSLSLKFPVLK